MTLSPSMPVNCLFIFIRNSLYHAQQYTNTLQNDRLFHQFVTTHLVEFEESLFVTKSNSGKVNIIKTVRKYYYCFYDIRKLCSISKYITVQIIGDFTNIIHMKNVISFNYMGHLFIFVIDSLLVNVPSRFVLLSEMEMYKPCNDIIKQ